MVSSSPSSDVRLLELLVESVDESSSESSAIRLFAMLEDVPPLAGVRPSCCIATAWKSAAVWGAAVACVVVGDVAAGRRLWIWAICISRGYRQGPGDA